MNGSRSAERVRQEIIRLCHAGLDSRTFRVEAVRCLRKIIPLNFRVRDDNLWEQRATDYDAHRQAQRQEAEDEAFARVAGEIAEKEAISVERMRVEMANFVDDVGPEVRRRIRDMLADESRELSLASLVQAQRVVLDTVKLLDRGEGGDDAPPPMTAEELEELLARTTPKPDA